MTEYVCSSSRSKGKGGKSAAKSAAAADATMNQSTAVTQPEPTQAAAGGGGGGGGGCLTGCRAFLRELDMDVFRLLYRRLSLTDHTSEQFCLRPSELLLLLDDLAQKLERRLASGGGGGLAAMHAANAARGLGFSHLDLLPELSVARQAATLLKPLSVIADSIVSMFRVRGDWWRCWCAPGGGGDRVDNGPRMPLFGSDVSDFHVTGRASDMTCALSGVVFVTMVSVLVSLWVRGDKVRHVSDM